MWYQLQIEQCRSNEIELLNEALDETGALAITLTDKNDDPVLEPEPGTTPLWPFISVNALYIKEDDAQAAKYLLEKNYPHLTFSIQELADQDWERVWMDDFKPQRFGQRLWVCPSWLEPVQPEAVNLILDPGLAFGTGTHPTTSLCLHWLDEADLSKKVMIDYGCGSGILALAALKLGAAKVYAVDIDQQALQATKNNALTNHIDEAQLVIDFPINLHQPVDLLMANILLAPLLNLREQFSELLTHQGTLIISGILDDQAPALIEAYQSHFTYQSTVTNAGWSLLTFTRVTN